MLGRKVNDILPPRQYELLHILGDDFPNEGLALHGQKRNSYQALQAIKGKQDLTYDFHGGDFGEELKIATPDLDALEGTKLRLDNQKEYDRYRGVADMLPYARGLSAKSYGFSPTGEAVGESAVDFSWPLFNPAS